jgi:tetratricopeptide (TPR) repeat protein
MDFAQMNDEGFCRHIASCSVTEIKRILDDWIPSSDSVLFARFALPIAEDLAVRSRTPATAACLFKLSLGLTELGRYREALAGYEEAQAIFARFDQQLSVGRCLMNRAVVLRELDRYEEAQAGYEDARVIFARFDQQIDVANCLMNRAISLRNLGRHEEALAGYEEAQAIYARFNRQVSVGRCLMNRAVVLRELGRYADSFAGFDEAQAIFLRFDQQIDVANCLMNRAISLRNLGRHEEALAGYEEAQAIYARFNRQVSVGRCLMNRAVVLDDLGRYEEAFAGLDEAQAIFASFDRQLSVARCLMNRAIVFRDLGRYEEAQAGYEGARAIFARFDQPIDVANCLMNRAVALRNLGRYEEAFTGFDEARAILTRFDQLNSLVRCLFGLSRTQEALGHRNGVRTTYLAACKTLERALSRVGGREEDMSGFRSGLPDPFLPAVRLLLDDAASAQLKGREGDVAAKREQAFLLAERSRSAKLREELSFRFTAEEPFALESADAKLFHGWQVLQRELSELDARLGARVRLGSQALEEEGAAQESERARILSASETQERELFSHNPEFAGLVSAVLPDLDELRFELAADEGIVAYLLGADGDGLIAFCLDAAGLQAATVADDPALDSTLQALAACIAACEREGYPAPGKGGEESDWRAALSAIGERLLAAPASLGWLSGAKRRLTFVPSGALFALPFAALGLPGMQPYRPLVAAVEVAVAPQAFTRLYQKRKGGSGRGAVAILNPDGSLASSEREAALLAESFPGIEIYRGEQPGSQPPLTARTVPDLIAGKRLVHFACHGRYERAAPWQSSLILAGEDGASQSQLTALQIYGRLRGSHELIFAAACESGRSTMLAGDAFIGLHRALLFRSREVLTTLFKVRDDATADLERLFYLAYAKSRDAVGALAAAQRAFIAATPGESTHVSGYLPSTHPYWWAGFVVFG